MAAIQEAWAKEKTEGLCFLLITTLPIISKAIWERKKNISIFLYFVLLDLDQSNKEENWSK